MEGVVIDPSFWRGKTVFLTGHTGFKGDWAKDRLIPDFLKALDAGQTLIIRSPDAIRPWQHVLEPISGYLVFAQKLFEEGSSFAEAWNISEEVVEQQKEKLKSTKFIVAVPELRIL